MTGVVSSVALGVTSIGANVLLLPIVVLSVGAAEYGVWLFLVSLITYGAYADLGTGTALSHFLANERGGLSPQSSRRWVPAASTISCLAFIAAALAFVPLSALFIQGSSADPALLIPVAIGLTSVLFKPASAILQGAGHYVLDRNLGLVAVVLRAGGTLTVCLVWPTIFAVALVEAIAIALPGLLAVPFAIRALRKRARTAKESMRERAGDLLSYGVRSLSVSLLGVTILQGGTIFLGIFGNPTAVTWWNASFRIYTACRQASTWVIAPFLPALTRLMATDATQAMKVVKAVTIAAVTATGVVVGATVPIAQELATVWLGPEAPVELISGVLCVLLIGLTLNTFHVPMTLAGDAVGRPGVFFGPQLAWLFGYAALAYPFYAAWGIVGLALALSAPLPVVELLYVLRASQALGIRARDWWADVVRPSIILFSPAIAVTSLIELTLGTRVSDLMLSGLFCLSLFLTAWLRKHAIPFDDLKVALRAEL